MIVAALMHRRDSLLVYTLQATSRCDDRSDSRSDDRPVYTPYYYCLIILKLQFNVRLG